MHGGREAVQLLLPTVFQMMLSATDGDDDDETRQHGHDELTTFFVLPPSLPELGVVSGTDERTSHASQWSCTSTDVYSRNSSINSTVGVLIGSDFSTCTCTVPAAAWLRLTADSTVHPGTD